MVTRSEIPETKRAQPVRILFLSDNFPPEVNAPASRTFEHCREWARAGCDVTVVTGVPNFPKGEIYPGYRNRLFQSEWMDGIRVVRVWTYIAPNEGFGRRTLDYISFMVAAVAAAPLIGRVDVVVGTSPQFFTVCAARVIAAIKRVPFVFELRDLWPESIKAVGAMKNGIVLRMLEALERHLYRSAAAIVCVTRSFKRELIARGVDGRKIAVVTNGVDLTRFRAQPKDPDLVRELGLTDKFVVGYIGTHGMAHALETVLDAAKMVQSSPVAGRVAFVFLGDGARKRDLKDYAGRLGLENVTFLDSVPKKDVIRFWSLLDVAIVHLRRTPLFRTVIPSKIFEAMAIGVPLLLGVEGEAAELVEQAGAGVIYEPENAASLCAAIFRLLDDPEQHRKLRACAITSAPRYDRRFLAAEMLRVLQQTVQASRESRRALR